MTDRIAPPEGAIVTRRRFLQGTALAGFGAFLAACSGGAHAGAVRGQCRRRQRRLERRGERRGRAPARRRSPDRSTSRTGTPTSTSARTRVDLADDRGLQGQYSVDVNYANAKIEDNESFVATIRPQLESGVDTGWDLIVITDWMAAKLVGLAGSRRSTRPTRRPRSPTSATSSRACAWDPDMSFHYPWQSGATGVGYNVEVDRPGPDQGHGPVRPGVQGQGHPPHRGPRHVPADPPRDAGVGQGVANAAEEMTAEDAQVVHDFLKPLVDDGQIKALHRQRVPAGLRQRRHLGRHGLVRRPRLVGWRGRSVRLPRRGRR